MKEMFNPNIFRSYDIRGVYKKDFDDDFAERLGKEFAAFLREIDKREKMEGKEIVVGRDVRLSSESLSKALIKGLTDICDVVDIGIVTTPMLYFSVAYLKKAGGVMITASHNPPEFNGFKLVGKMGRPISGAELEKIKELILKGRKAKNVGKVEKYDISKAYENFILGKIKLKRKLKVVLDTCNSVTGLIAPRLFERAGCEVITINKELDGRFPSRPPEPKVEYLRALQEAVRANKADFGVAYDGDGDRVVFVDENGNVIDSGNLIIMIFAEHYLKKSGQKVVFDLSCSVAVEEIIKSFGGVPIITAVGTSNIKKTMAEHKAILGGESSNHLYFADTFNFDDAIYASLKMAEIISESGSLSEKIKSLPKYPYISEWTFECPDEKKFRVIDIIKEKFKGENISELDGVKLILDDGWVLWRVSNTRPQIKIYAEARNDERFEELKSFAKNELLKAMGDSESYG